MTEKEKLQAIENAKPKAPNVYELGGDYYYKCYWVKCGQILSKWDNYCPKCGQKIDWSNL